MDVSDLELQRNALKEQIAENLKKQADAVSFCLGDSCPRRHTAVLICDECGDEVEKLYKVEGMQLCSRCALVELEVVEL